MIELGKLDELAGMVSIDANRWAKDLGSWEDGHRGYRFPATGTFDRLLTGAKVVNDGGGGQGS